MPAGEWGYSMIPLTEPEIADWVQGLGSTDARRVERLQELLRNAVGDQMSPEDRVICVNALRKLHRGLVLIGTAR